MSERFSHNHSWTTAQWQSLSQWSQMPAKSIRQMVLERSQKQPGEEERRAGWEGRRRHTTTRHLKSLFMNIQGVWRNGSRGKRHLILILTAKIWSLGPTQCKEKTNSSQLYPGLYRVAKTLMIVQTDTQNKQIKV